MCQNRKICSSSLPESVEKEKQENQREQKSKYKNSQKSSICKKWTQTRANIRLKSDIVIIIKIITVRIHTIKNNE